MGVFLPVRVRTREMLSFVLLLTSHGGEQRLQFEAADPIIAQPPEKRIATGHFRIEAKCGEVIRRAQCGHRFPARFLWF